MCLISKEHCIVLCVCVEVCEKARREWEKEHMRHKTPLSLSQLGTFTTGNWKGLEAYFINIHMHTQPHCSEMFAPHCKCQSILAALYGRHAWSQAVLRCCCGQVRETQWIVSEQSAPFHRLELCSIFAVVSWEVQASPNYTFMYNKRSQQGRICGRGKSSL